MVLMTMTNRTSHLLTKLNKQLYIAVNSPTPLEKQHLVKNSMTLSVCVIAATISEIHIFYDTGEDLTKDPPR